MHTLTALSPWYVFVPQWLSLHLHTIQPALTSVQLQSKQSMGVPRAKLQSKGSHSQGNPMALPIKDLRSPLHSARSNDHLLSASLVCVV